MESMVIVVLGLAGGLGLGLLLRPRRVERRPDGEPGADPNPNPSATTHPDHGRTGCPRCGRATEAGFLLNAVVWSPDGRGLSPERERLDGARFPRAIRHPARRCVDCRLVSFDY